MFQDAISSLSNIFRRKPCVIYRTDFEQITRGELVAQIRTTPGGKNLNPEMTHLLALAMFGDYLLFPSKQERECITAYVNPDAPRSQNHSR